MDKKIRYVPYVNCKKDDHGPLFWEQYEFSSDLESVSKYCEGHNSMPDRESKPMAIVDIEYLNYLIEKAGEF